MHRRIFILLLIIVFLLAASSYGVCQRVRIIRAMASSVEADSAELAPEKSIDKNISTRWSSKHFDPQWITYDFLKEKEFDVVSILWETAYGKVYDLQVSDDGENWQTIYKESEGGGGEDLIILDKRARGRHVRLFGKKRGTDWGYSIYEFEVINTDDAAPGAPEGLSYLPGVDSVFISWDKNKEFDLYGYDIYRSPSKEGEFIKVNSSPVSKSYYVDKDVRDGRQYYYRVSALDYQKRESRPSSVISARANFTAAEGTYLDKNLPIDKRVEDLLSRMTLEEKIDQLSGLRQSDDMTTHGNERLGIPSLKCADGPHGVRWGTATAFPVPIAAAASFNPENAYLLGVGIGREIKGKGRNVSLGPCLNIARDPRAGRTFEGFGEDPYLAGRMAASQVAGIQSEQVIATAKHYACNNKEAGRSGGPVIIDERSLREIYLPAFKACVKKAGTISIMGAYNKVNGEYACENAHLLRGILKGEWGFKGYVVTDWNALHSTVPAIKAGLDLEMPRKHHYGDYLVKAVKKGEVAEEYIDDAAGRILYAKFWAGLFDGEIEADPDMINTAENQAIAYKMAREGIVLLKNEEDVLPLERRMVDSIYIGGPNADITTAGTELGSSQITSVNDITVYDGIREKAGDIDIVSSPRSADVAVVAVGLSSKIAGRVEGEGIDRYDLKLPGSQDAIIKDIARNSKKTVVVVIGGSAVNMQDWIDEVDAVVMAWYAGEAGGRAIADVLFGDYNPGGKLPLTFAKSAAQLAPFDWDYRDEYKRGVGYMYFEKKGLEPLFPFGYGLSYSRFKYLGMELRGEGNNIEIRTAIKNIGRVEGDEVVQLYIGPAQKDPDQPLKKLKGFKRLGLKPHETKSVLFKIEPEELAQYIDGRWVVKKGAYEVSIGSSSQDIYFKKTFEVPRDIIISPY